MELWGKFKRMITILDVLKKNKINDKDCDACQVFNEKVKTIETLTYENLDEYHLSGTFDCKVVRVFDGDTLHVVVCKDNAYYRVCCRLLDIDAPEMPRAHAEAMTEESRSAFRARDRLVELLTNVTVPKAEDQPDGVFRDTSGTPLPSVSDNDLQNLIDKNSLFLKDGVTLQGTDKFGRYLAHIFTPFGQNVSQILLNEKHAVPFP